MEPHNEQEQMNTTETVPARPRGRMNRRAVVLAMALFLVLIAGMFIFAFLQQNEGEPADQTGTDIDTEDRYASIETVTAKHFYEDGVHTLVGEIPMPTPCDLVEADVRVAESMPEQVMVSFEVVNNAEFCAQVITDQRFMVTATTSADATFSATFNGRPVTINLVDPAPGESPEDFELFIKG
jgi:hypothetical protein